MLAKLGKPTKGHFSLFLGGPIYEDEGSTMKNIL